jgi:hypothetical protein
MRKGVRTPRRESRVRGEGVTQRESLTAINIWPLSSSNVRIVDMAVERNHHRIGELGHCASSVSVSRKGVRGKPRTLCGTWRRR